MSFTGGKMMLSNCSCTCVASSFTSPDFYTITIDGIMITSATMMHWITTKGIAPI